MSNNTERTIGDYLNRFDTMFCDDYGMILKEAEGEDRAQQLRDFLRNLIVNVSLAASSELKPGYSLGMDPEPVIDENATIEAEYAKEEDPWAHRSEGMKCHTCMWFVKRGDKGYLGRCRRNAPTMNGFPSIQPDDWCGSHKLDENKI